MRQVSHLLFGLLVATSVAGGGIDLDLKGVSHAYFSSTASTDEITASVIGGSCDDSEFRVEIRGQTGVYYEHSSALRKLVECDRYRDQPDELRRIAAHLVNHALALDRASNRSCDARFPGCWAGPQLARLKRDSAAILCLVTGWEEVTCVAFDPEVGKTVEVWRSQE